MGDAIKIIASNGRQHGHFSLLTGPVKATQRNAAQRKVTLLSVPLLPTRPAPRCPYRRFPARAAEPNTFNPLNISRSHARPRPPLPFLVHPDHSFIHPEQHHHRQQKPIIDIRRRQLHLPPLSSHHNHTQPRPTGTATSATSSTALQNHNHTHIHRALTRPPHAHVH